MSEHQETRDERSKRLQKLRRERYGEFADLTSLSFAELREPLSEEDKDRWAKLAAELHERLVQEREPNIGGATLDHAKLSRSRRLRRFLEGWIARHRF